MVEHVIRNDGVVGSIPISGTTFLKRACLPASLLVLALAACAPRAPVFDADRITADVRILSSDEFAGRAPASEGETLTIAHLVAQLKSAGLEPGGERQPDGSRVWTQDVPLLRTQIDGPANVTIHAKAEMLVWTQGEETTIRAPLTGAEQVTIDNAPLVFVGYGVSAPERQWDDFKDLDLAGKVALILVNDPDFETGAGDFGGKAMTYYGRWTYKFEEAARRGAVGALVIHETAPAAYGWATVKNSNAATMFDVVRTDPAAYHAPVEGWIQRDAAALLLARAGLDYEQLKTQARTREFRPTLLPGVTFSTQLAVRKEQVVSRNVIGVLPGRSRADEWVFYTAHWDHMGVGLADASGDAIYNGAVDNAAGTAQLLEIARGYAKSRRPARSVGFLFVAAEEKGLLGSEYYAANPLYPLAKTVAVLNSDAPQPVAPARDFSTSGDAPLTLQDTLIEVGRSFQRRYTPESRPEAGLFFRSDHFPFAKRGVPAISFKSGEDLTEGGTAAGQAIRDAYTNDRYHQPADEFEAATWRSDGIAADAALLYALGRRLADSQEWPEWKAGAEFKAARDASAAERQ